MIVERNAGSTSSENGQVRKSPKGNGVLIGQGSLEESNLEKWSDEALARLRAAVSGRRRSLIVTHDNPDPDGMASAAGMSFLYRSMGVPRSRLAYGGIIGRAENRAMVRLLGLHMIPFSRIQIDAFDLVTLVDTQHLAGNHSLPRSRPPDVIVDHHPIRSQNHGKGLALVSTKHGSTSSMVTELIRKAGLEPGTALSTALFYGVKSDTRALGRGSSPADTIAYRWLFQRAEQTLLAKIEHPDVPLSYFQAYHTAFERARIHGNVITVDLGEVYAPDIVPEIAERLLSLEQVSWSIATGSYHGDLYVSVRTNDRRRNAGRQMLALTRDLGGSAGGHGSMAGARLPLPNSSESSAGLLAEEIFARFRRLLGVEVVAGEPIVQRG